jgi:beta-lactamase regulating signal transducer with metallopeptidase domain
MLRELPAVVLVVGLIPLLWSGAVALLRGITGRSVRALAMRLEAAILILMIAPVLVGALLLVLAQLAPDAPLPGLDLRDIEWPQVWAPSPRETAAAPVLAGVDVWSIGSLIVVAIYLVGLAGAAFRLIGTRRRLDKIAATGVPCSTLGADVRITDETIPPFASWCGAIILPRVLVQTLPRVDFALIIRHERAHLDRGDPRSFWALAWIDVVFWPHPLVRRQTARCRLAAELACDTAVTEGAPACRVAYAGAFVAAIELATDSPLWAAGILSARTRGEHRVRLTQILSPAPASRSKLTRLSVAAAALLVVPMGAVQLVACSLGEAPQHVRGGAGESAPQAIVSEPAFEITAVKGATVQVQRIAEDHVRLAGPLRAAVSDGSAMSFESVDVYFLPTEQDASGREQPKVERMTFPRVFATGGRGFVVKDGHARPVRPEDIDPNDHDRTRTGETIHRSSAARPTEGLNAMILFGCGLIVSLPQLGQLETASCPLSASQAGAAVSQHVQPNPVQ